jgi:hypothetical protein
VKRFTIRHPAGNAPDTSDRYKYSYNRIPPPGDEEAGVRSSGGTSPWFLRVVTARLLGCSGAGGRWSVAALTCRPVDFRRASYAHSPVASQTFTHSAQFAGSIDQAWSTLQEADTWGLIGGVEAVSDAHHDPVGNLLSYSFAAAVAGKRYPGRARVATSDRPRLMIVQIDTSELAGNITVQLATTGTAGALGVELAVRSKSLLSGMMFPLISNAIGSGLGANVEAIARRIGTV